MRDEPLEWAFQLATVRGLAARAVVSIVSSDERQFVAELPDIVCPKKCEFLQLNQPRDCRAHDSRVAALRTPV